MVTTLFIATTALNSAAWFWIVTATFHPISRPRRLARWAAMAKRTT